jgi:hypothetical protein
MLLSLLLMIDKIAAGSLIDEVRFFVPSITSTSLPLRSLFEALAIDTWNRIDLGWRYECNQGEETLTDINLLSLKIGGGPSIKVWKVAKPEEAKRGIDWHWIVRSNGKWRHYGIQAKKLDHTGKYLHIRHPVGHPATQQIVLLEKFSTDTGAIPLYCFFNHSNAVVEKQHWHCGQSFEKEQLGCTLVHLEVVKKAHKPRKGKTFGDLHSSSLSLPWRCLVGCTCSSATDATKEHPFFNPGDSDAGLVSGPLLDLSQMDESRSIASFYGEEEGTVLPSYTVIFDFDG